MTQLNQRINLSTHSLASAVISNATVTLTNVATGATRTATTNAEGFWKVPVLEVGVFKITVEATGFKKGTTNDIQVEAAVPRTVNVQLAAGAVGETVDIVAAADLVQRETAATFRQLNAEELTKVPTSTRSFTHLLSAEAGVSSDSTGRLTITCRTRSSTPTTSFSIKTASTARARVATKAVSQLAVR